MSQLPLMFAHWIHDIDPYAIRFPENGILEGIRWYGLAYLSGFVVGWGLLYLYYKKGKFPLNFDQQSTLISALMIGVLVGGRLGHMLLYQLPEFLSNPLIFFQFWQGGMASHGGFVGVILAMFWFSRKYHYSFWEIADPVVTAVPPGLFFGRLANFINGELFGTVTEIPWGIVFPRSLPPYFPIEMIPARHPVQLYEAVLEGVVLFLYLQWRYWTRNPRTTNVGQLSGEFLLGYSIMRIACEFFKEPTASNILGMNRGIIYSLFIAIAGIGVIYVRRKALKNTLTH